MRWLREPLVQFLALGGMLFVAYASVRPHPAKAPAATQIRLTPDDLRQLELGFAAQWNRPPSLDELNAMIEEKIRLEVLYREGLALGLDKDDMIVKRRMAQKIEFLAEDESAAHEPSPGELAAWFDKNKDRFALPARITLRHLYFSPDRRGAHARDDAARALARLAGKAEDAPGAAALGDPFMFQDYLADRAPGELAKEFGPGFAQAVLGLAPGAWRGPVESGYGWHVVFVESITPSRVPGFDEVSSDVKTAWLAAQKADAWDKAYATMRAKYEVVLPPRTSAIANVAQTPSAKAAP